MFDAGTTYPTLTGDLGQCWKVECTYSRYFIQLLCGLVLIGISPTKITGRVPASQCLLGTGFQVHSHQILLDAAACALGSTFSYTQSRNVDRVRSAITQDFWPQHIPCGCWRIKFVHLHLDTWNRSEYSNRASGFEAGSPSINWLKNRCLCSCTNRNHSRGTSVGCRTRGPLSRTRPRIIAVKLDASLNTI